MEESEDKDEQNINHFHLSHIKDFFFNLNEMRKDGINTDVILVCNDKEFPAHQLVLSAGSPYFKTMFESGFQESSTKRVDFSYVREHILSSILDFLYVPSKADICNENFETLLEIHALAHLFNMIWLAELCWNLITKQLNVESCLNVWKAVRIYKDVPDIDKIEKYLLNNLQYIIQQEAFLQLNDSELKLIIQKIQQTHFQTGDDFLEAIIKWVTVDDERKNCLIDIFGSLNFEFTSKECLEQILAIEPPLCDELNLQELLQEKVQPKLKPKHILEDIFCKMYSSHSLIKRGLPAVKFFYFGSYENDVSGSVIDEYPATWVIDIQNKTNPTLKWLPFKFYKETTYAYYSSKLYFIGCNEVYIGDSKTRADSLKQEIFLFDWKESVIEWSIPLPRTVEDIHLCALHNKIYVIGRNYTPVNSELLDIQFYNMDLKEWSTIYIFHENCSEIQCITTKERIYIFCESNYHLCEMFEISDDICSHLFTFSYSQKNISPKMNTVHKNEIYRFQYGSSTNYICHVHSPYTVYSSFSVICSAKEPMRYCFSTETEGIFFYNEDNNIFYFDKDKHEIKKISSVHPKIKREPTIDENCPFKYDTLLCHV